MIFVLCLNCDSFNLVSGSKTLEIASNVGTVYEVIRNAEIRPTFRLTQSVVEKEKIDCDSSISGDTMKWCSNQHY